MKQICLLTLLTFFSIEAYSYNLYCEGWLLTSEAQGAEFGKMLQIEENEARNFKLWDGEYDNLNHQITLTPVDKKRDGKLNYKLESLNRKTGMKFSIQGELNQTLAIQYTDSSSLRQAREVYVKCFPLYTILRQPPERPSKTNCNGHLKKRERIIKTLKNEEVLWRGRGIGYRPLISSNEGISGDVRALVKVGIERPSANLILNGVNFDSSLNFNLTGEMGRELDFHIKRPGDNPFEIKLSCSSK